MALDGRIPLVPVPIVLPASNDPNTSGKVRNLGCGGGVCHRQLMRTGDGYEVHPTWARKGWRLLRDMYLDEDNEAGWETYCEYLADTAAGRTASSFPSHLLPRAVQERQRCMLPDRWSADKWRVKPTTGAIVEPPADAQPEHTLATKVKGPKEARS